MQLVRKLKPQLSRASPKMHLWPEYGVRGITLNAHVQRSTLRFKNMPLPCLRTKSTNWGQALSRASPRMRLWPVYGVSLGQALIIFITVFIVLFFGCDQPASSTSPPAWPVGSEPTVISGSGNFILKPGSPSGQVNLVIYYYAVYGTTVPAHNKNAETDWIEWNRLNYPGQYDSLEGDYVLYALASSGQTTVRSRPVYYTIYTKSRWIQQPEVIKDLGKFTLDNSGVVLGEPEPVMSYYYGRQGAIPPIDSTTGWTSAGFTEMQVGATVVDATGSYILYGVATNIAGSVLSDIVDIFVLGAPLWDTLPVVDTAKGGLFTFTGEVVHGLPTPTVTFYYAVSTTLVPEDPTGDWVAAGFTEVVKDVVNIQVTPGNYILYGIATNDHGANQSEPIEFIIHLPIISLESDPVVDASKTGQFLVMAATVTGDPEPIIKYYYAARGTTAPTEPSGDWIASGFIDITETVLAGKSVSEPSGGDFALYALATSAANIFKISQVVEFSVIAATPPTWTTPPTITTDIIDNIGQFVITEGKVAGDPVPEVIYYYGFRGVTPGAATDTDWLDYLFGSAVVGQAHKVNGGEYDLYAIVSNVAGAELTGPIAFEILGKPYWKSEPKVSVNFNTFTVADAGRSDGNPEPTNRYYYGPHYLTPPSDITSDWTISAFTEITSEQINNREAIQPQQIGAYRLYAISTNQYGSVMANFKEVFLTDPITHVAPSFTDLPYVYTHASSNLTLYAAKAIGTPEPTISYYISLASASNFPDWTDSGDSTWTTPGHLTDNGYTQLSGWWHTIFGSPGNYRLYAFAENDGGATLSPPVIFTMTSAEPPIWVVQPAVTPSIGKFTVTLGTLKGISPKLKYYYALNSVSAPIVLNGDWTSFTDIYNDILSGNAISETAGDYQLYGLAQFGEIYIISNQISFTIQ